MKISELIKLLKEYQKKYGDLEIKTYDTSMDKSFSIKEGNVVSMNEYGHIKDDPEHVKYIAIW